MDAVTSTQFRQRDAGVDLSENADDLCFGKTTLTHQTPPPGAFTRKASANKALGRDFARSDDLEAVQIAIAISTFELLGTVVSLLVVGTPIFGPAGPQFRAA
jgi:hypothetical protein